MKKILHAPYNEANSSYSLSLAERINGAYSRCYVYGYDNFFKDSDGLIKVGQNVIINEILRWIFILYVLCKFDVIHYYFGATLGPRPLQGSKLNILKRLFNIYASKCEYIDLVVARFLGKKIFVTFLGSDARDLRYSQSYKWHYSNEIGFEIDYAKNSECQDRLLKISKYVDGIFALNPDLLNTLPSRAMFMPYSSVFPGRYLKEKRGDGKKLKIVHAPSNRMIKGTHYIVNAINNLSKKGYDFEFVLVEQMCHEDAARVYKSADIVIDQLLAGWYGTLAVEAMSMGIPVICYINEDDLKWLPDGMRKELPLINANPSNIEAVIEECIKLGSANLQSVGEKSKKFVENWHNPIVNAKKYLDMYGC